MIYKLEDYPHLVSVIGNKDQFFAIDNTTGKIFPVDYKKLTKLKQ